MNSHDFTIPVAAGDQLFFEVRSDKNLGSSVSWSPKITYTQYCPNDSSTCANVQCTQDGQEQWTCTPSGNQFVFNPDVQFYYLDPQQEIEAYGGGFREWYYGQWNSGKMWAESLMVIETKQADGSYAGSQDFTRMVPLPGGNSFSQAAPVWLGSADRCFIGSSVLSSTRINPKASSATIRLSSGVDNSSTRSGAGVSWQQGSGNSGTSLDLIDMNGDHYPDQVTTTGVTLNDGKSGFTTPSRLNPGNFRTVTNESTSYNLGVGPVVSNISSAGQYLFSSGSGAYSSGDFSSLFSVWNLFSLNLGYTEGTASTQSDLIDINGDGLPDLVTQGPPEPDGSGKLLVRLNLGSRFGYQEEWRTPANIPMRKSSNKTIAGTFGTHDWLNYSGGSWGINLGVTNHDFDMVDVNDDGLPDMVSKNSNDSFMVVRINQGGRFGNEEKWAIPFWQFSSSLDPEAVTAQMLSVAPDLFTSLLLSVSDQELYQRLSAFLYNDTLSNSATVSYIYGFFNTNFVLMDTISAGIVNGSGLFAPAVRSSKDSGSLASTSTYKRKFGLGSLPGGNLLESSVLGFPDSSELYQLISPLTGNPLSWIIREDNISNPDIHNNPFVTDYNPQKIPTHSTTSHIDFTDIDGDGLPDHIFKITHDADFDKHTILVKRNLSSKANLLKSANGPLGGSFTINYKRKGNKVDFSNQNQSIDMPKSYWVLSKVTRNDGMKDSSGRLKNVYETSYAYDSGFYSRDEREFYGFHTVAETRGSGNDTVTIVNTYHNQNYYLKGLLANSITRSGSIQDIKNIQSTVNPAYVATENDYELVPGSDPLSQFPELTMTTTNYYDVSTQSIVKNTSQEYNSYDEYGNLLEYVDRADNGTVDDIYVSIGYNQKDTAHYIMDKPSSILVKDTKGTIYRSRSGNYENGTGNLLNFTMLVQGGKNAQWNMTYYPDGNLWTITLPAGDPQYNKYSDGYKLKYVYDDDVETYVTGISDSFGYSSSALYDPRFGQPLTTKDINGNFRVNNYDDFGRLIAVYGPNAVNSGGSPVCQPTVSFTYDVPASNNIPARAVTTNRADSFLGCTSATINTTTFADGLKRIIQIRKDADVTRDGGLTVSTGVIVSGTVVFDSLGRTIQQGQPAFRSGYAYEDLTTQYPTLFTYDTLDRTNSIVTPDKATTTMSYGFDTSPDGAGMLFLVKVVDPMYRSKESYKDVHDRIHAVKEHGKLEGTNVDIKTIYAYNIMGEIINVTDAKNNQTNITYDLLGNRLTIDNPDTGLTTYTYDANGNVTTKQTANLKNDPKYKGQPNISYTYEYNRLKTISYPTTTAVTYEYGGSNEGGDQHGNLAGRIKQVKDESGTEQRWYGRLGETTKELRQVNASNNTVAKTQFETDYVFDSFGRMKQLTYPDGEMLTYIYDNGGLLKSAIGTKRGNQYVYINNLLYDEFGQREMIKYGNGVKTNYTYDPLTRRLIRLTTILPSGRSIQDSSYQYDLVGNILQLGTDNQALIPTGGNIGGPTVQIFAYDDLYQLISASGTHWSSANSKTTYADSFAYDIIGNITQKIQQHLVYSTSSSNLPKETNYSWNYAYNGVQPHAVTNTSDVTTRTPVKNYTYDSDGNMAGWTTANANRIITWNEENRVKNITDSGNGTSFLYDDQGERVVKGGGGNETVYINRFYSIKNSDLASKHVFAGETRVVTKLEKDGGSIQSGVPGSIALINSQGIKNAITRGNGRQVGINRRLSGTSGGTSTTTTTTTTNPPIEKFEFFYHGDHLGSSNFITDDLGAVYQDLEYFPYGEQWVEDGGSGQMPYYRFTGKELDPETGLYYYGARYYDPVLSRWISADPILGKYLPSRIENKDQLVGMGGIFNPFNLGLYTYAHNNPVIFKDPDGNFAWKIPFVKAYFVAELVSSGGHRGASVGINTTAALEKSHPYLTLLADRMREPAEKTFARMEAKGYKPQSVENPVRTVEQQKQKIEQGYSKPTSLYTSKHVDRAGTGKSEAMDIMDTRWGQIDKTPEQRQFFRELGDVGKQEGLKWGGDFKPINKNTGYGWDPGHLEMPDLPKQQPSPGELKSAPTSGSGF